MKHDIPFPANDSIALPEVPLMTIIAAVDGTGAIGRDNRLLWRLKSDMRFFRETTSGGVVIMGRKSFESIGRPLSNRYNIILSQNPSAVLLDMVQADDTENCAIASSCEEAQALAQEIVADVDGRYGNKYSKGIFIIGGGEIYRQFLPLVGRCLISHVAQTYPDSDCYFDLAALGSFAWQTGSKRCLASYAANPPDDEAAFEIWDYSRVLLPQAVAEQELAVG